MLLDQLREFSSGDPEEGGILMPPGATRSAGFEPFAARIPGLRGISS